MNRSDYLQLKHIPLGGIPGGSGNAIVEEVLYLGGFKRHFHNALYTIIKGKYIDINVNKYTL